MDATRKMNTSHDRISRQTDLAGPDWNNYNATLTDNCLE